MCVLVIKCLGKMSVEVLVIQDILKKSFQNKASKSRIKVEFRL